MDPRGAQQGWSPVGVAGEAPVTGPGSAMWRWGSLRLCGHLGQAGQEGGEGDRCGCQSGVRGRARCRWLWSDPVIEGPSRVVPAQLVDVVVVKGGCVPRARLLVRLQQAVGELGWSSWRQGSARGGETAGPPCIHARSTGVPLTVPSPAAPGRTAGHGRLLPDEPRVRENL